MTDARTPWWYSGGEEGESQDAAPDEATERAERESPTTDWMGLLAGAVRMVDWATSTVMAPHSEHEDPAEHPECLVCRTITLVGDPVGLTTTVARSGATPPAAPAPEVRWLPFEPGPPDEPDGAHP